MQSVLCFGDSLTWGYDPDTGGRHAFADRWPSILAAELPGVDVIAEGLRGRSTCRDNGSAPCDYNGARVLPMMLHSHGPLDVVIIMLGLNDIVMGYRPDQVSAGLRRLVEIVQTHPMRVAGAKTPDILLVSQPPLVIGQDPIITATLVAASRRLARMTEIVAMENDLPWLNGREVAEASQVDCVHLPAKDTRALGTMMVEPVRAMLEARKP